MEDLRIEVPGGHIAVRDYGGAGRTVVLVHSVGYSCDVWRRLAPLLSGSARVLAVDLRGHGQSTAQVDTVADLVADFERLVAALALRCPVLVGHQYGGGIAAAVAARYPLLWGGLCVIDSPVIGTQAEYRELLDLFSTPAVSADLARRFRLGVCGQGIASRDEFCERAGEEMSRDWLSVPRLSFDNYSVRRSVLTDEATGRWERQPNMETVARLTKLGTDFPLMPGRELLERVAAPVWVLQPEAGEYGQGFDEIEALARTRLGWAAVRMKGSSFVAHTQPEVVRDALVTLLSQLPTQREPAAEIRSALVHRVSAIDT